MIMTNANAILNQTNSSKSPIKITIEYGSLGIAFDMTSDFNSQTWNYGSLIYEGLVAQDWNNPNDYLPVLAESWNESSNGTVYTFYLRHNIKFTDGTPFNAYTMKYSIDLDVLQNDQDSIYIDHFILGAQQFVSMTDINITQANAYLQAGGVTALDEYTLQIKLFQPYLFFLGFMAYYPKAFSPKELIDHMPKDYSTNQSDDIYGMISLQTEFPHLTDWTKLGL